MSRAILKQAIREVRAGQDRNKVFQNHVASVRNPKHLAMAVGSVARPELAARYRLANFALAALLVLAALIKLIGGLLYFLQYGVFIGIVAVLLGIVVPVIFAVAVAKMEGQVYSILIILCVISALNVLIKIGDHGLWAVPDLVLIGLIAGLAGWLKGKLFPNLGFFGPRKDPSGAYQY